MASEGSHVQSAPQTTAPVAPAPPVVSEQPQPIHNVLNTTQTDSEPNLFETKVGAGTENPEAPELEEQAKPPEAPATTHPPGTSVAASELEAPVAAQKAPEPPKEEPNPVTEAPEPVTETSKPVAEAPKPVTQAPETGKKRDLDSRASSSPVLGTPPVAKPIAEEADEPEVKKQKTDQAPIKDTNGTTPTTSAAPIATTSSVAPTAEANEKPKKASRSKKEKIKDAVKKVISTDGIGSRTRSRTKNA
ncbi:uncharacterized protein N7482_003577 [Penicillium canariense]|uniref:Uncharacterized protein n=1 Tax=Penicillium canariense TaxID=189055 RepID=A0A9W9I717_9EURO|nr:uncharacterized protein N7482_003577 [Penicillium canariense]KAJ5167983.1 hypothetical protein N7482_003577 [Penicillium canariense]